MEFAIAKVSTKGQIVIPNPLREGISAGDEFLMIKDDGRILMKDLKKVARDIRDDFIFAEKVERAWQDYNKGKFIKKSKDDFLKELRAC